MASKRIVYQNWIVDLGRDPDCPVDPDDYSGEVPEFVPLDGLSTEDVSDRSAGGVDSAVSSTDDVRKAVEVALEQLSDEEREFVVRFYIMGESYRQMSEKTNQAIYKLEATNKRVVRRLKALLGGFVKQRFGLAQSQSLGCPICESIHRKEIDDLIARRDPASTWRPIMQTLREKYQIKIHSPQRLIGHEKYH